MKKIAAFLVLVIASAALVACGGGGKSTSTTATTSGGNAPAGGAAAPGGGGETIDIEADPNGQLAYTTDKISAKPGKATVDFTNPQSLEHDVAIENAAGETIAQTELVAEGTSSTVVDLKPGTYHYYCSVPGHRDAGMEGTLIVK